jgi:hypothetical protein
LYDEDEDLESTVEFDDVSASKAEVAEPIDDQTDDHADDKE